MGKKLTALRYCYTVFLVVLVGLFVCFVQSVSWLQTDLRALLPQSQYWSAIQIQADNLQEQQLNQQIVALVGNRDSAVAFSTAQQIAEQWQQSHLFRQINLQTQPDLNQLKHEIEQLRLAVLPADIIQQLLNQSQQYFQQYTEQIINPFGQTGLLSPEQDWLGLGRFTLAQSQQLTSLQWNVDNGMIFAEQEGLTWVLLRAQLTEGNLIDPQQSLLQLVESGRQLVEAQQGQLLVTGPSIFAAVAKQQAESESRLMSLLGVGLTLLLLLVVFRTLKVLWLFLPIAIGMLCGVIATVLVFGHIHILTLVIGTSLIGVLIDFPLHWLTSSLFTQQWRGQQAMNKLRFTFFISLLVTLLGYGLLGFTALPVLQQTALFSGVALICAMLATLLYLPVCFVRYQTKVRSIFGEFCSFSLNKSVEKVGLIGLSIFILIGLAKSQWQDDIRQWVSVPPELLQQAQKIGEITGIDLGSQYFLLIAENDEALLLKEHQLMSQLYPLKAEGKVAQMLGLSQWIMPQSAQQQFAEQLQQLQAEDYQMLTDIGVPPENIRAAITQLVQQPPLSLADALNTTLGQPWKNLYLGQLNKEQVGAVVKLSGIRDLNAVSALANNRDIYWQDKRASLNQAFQATRDQAGWLKLLSFLLAGVLLWRYFGLKHSLKMLAIPLAAIVLTVAVFGWLGIAVNLFAMFGLLLVSAIGIDYTAYLQTAQEPWKVKQTAVFLAATTTLISFILLSLSSTPAVASFGLSVSIGVLLSVLISFRVLR